MKTIFIEPTVEEVLEVYENAYNILKSAEDKSPRNEKVNKALYSLVNTVLAFEDKRNTEKILNDSIVQKNQIHMRNLLSKAESEMEKFFTEKFLLNQQLTLATVKEFLYWKCYESLVEIERFGLEKITTTLPTSMAFVGSGPLPLTALLWQFVTKGEVICLECDSDAVKQSAKLIKRLGKEDNIKVVEADGCLFDYQGLDFVMIASLVPNKNEIMKQISSTAENALIGIRNVEDLHTLLYEPLKEEELKGFHLLHQTKATKETINCTAFVKSQFNKI